MRGRHPQEQFGLTFKEVVLDIIEPCVVGSYGFVSIDMVSFEEQPLRHGANGQRFGMLALRGVVGSFDEFLLLVMLHKGEEIRRGLDVLDREVSGVLVEFFSGFIEQVLHLTIGEDVSFGDRHGFVFGDRMDETFVEPFGTAHDFVHGVFCRFLLGDEDIELLGFEMGEAVGVIFPNGVESCLSVIEEAH